MFDDAPGAPERRGGVVERSDAPVPRRLAAPFERGDAAFGLGDHRFHGWGGMLRTDGREIGKFGEREQGVVGHGVRWRADGGGAG